MLAFRDTLETCSLIDLGFFGVPFTYANKRGGQANVKVRLDRAVASNSWRNLFACSEVRHLISPCSDHVPLLLKGEAESGFVGSRCRQYEILWERDSALPEIIKEAWGSFDVVDNLGKL